MGIDFHNILDNQHKQRMDKSIIRAPPHYRHAADDRQPVRQTVGRRLEIYVRPNNRRRPSLGARLPLKQSD